MIYADRRWPGGDFKALFSTREFIGLLKQGVFTYKEAKNWKELANNLPANFNIMNNP